VTASHGFKEVVVFLETIFADEVIAAQNSPAEHRCTFHFKTENTNPLCYKMNLAFRIHISYKQNQKRITTMTKTIMVQDIGQFKGNGCFQSKKHFTELISANERQQLCGKVARNMSLIKRSFTMK